MLRRRYETIYVKFRWVSISTATYGSRGGCVTKLWLFWYWNKYSEDPRRKINIYLHKRKEKEVTQETMLRGFIVRAHKLKVH